MDSPPTSRPGGRAPVGQPGLPPAYEVRSQRERLLEAMLRVAAAKGRQETTVRDVAEFAGVSASAFEAEFDGRDECFMEAYEAAIGVIVAHVESAHRSAGEAPWPQRVVAGLRALVELLAAESEMARMAMVEVTAVGEEARERSRAAMDRFIPLLEEGRAYSGRGDELPADTARFAIGGVASMIFDEVRAGRGEELERALPDLAFAVLMPYLGSEAAEAERREIARTA